MLILSRRLNEKILLPTVNASIQVIGLQTGAVRLGISAPADVPVLREELQGRVSNAPRNAAAPRSAAKTPALPRITEAVQRRLSIALRGMEQLREHLADADSEEVEQTWEAIYEDLHSLNARLTEEIRPRSASSKGAAYKTLLVEDDANERELLASFLRMAGLDVDLAGDGADALDHLRKERPDVLLLDMGLPRVDGAAAVREIRRDPAYRDLKIFAVSGHLPEEYDLRTGPGGIDRWFHKPLDPVALLRDMNEAVTGSAGISA